MNIKKLLIIAMSGILALSLSACDGDSSYDTGDSYSYHDAAGNGYNDDDVNWEGGGKGDKSKSWDQAVNDWNRENGY